MPPQSEEPDEHQEGLLPKYEVQKEDEGREIPRPPIRRSLLGDLPPLTGHTSTQIGPQQQNRQIKAVDFTDPLHSSISRLITSPSSQ